MLRQVPQGMSTSRQARRQLGRSLKALGKAPLDADEISFFSSEEMGAVTEDVKLAAGRCAACLSTSGERKSCHACSFVRYCNRECQVAGWPSHKLICRVLAADREIAAAKMSSVSAPLLPLATIWERLRGGGHAEAFEATAHLQIWADRCGLDSEPASGSDLEHIAALRAEVAAAGGIALLVSGLAAGGLRAMAAAEALEMLASDHPETGAAIIAAGALPPLIYALELPSKHASFGNLWGLGAAAEGAATLIRSLGSGSPVLSKSVVDAGAIPALILHLKFVTRDAFPPPHWPAFYFNISHVRASAIDAISFLFSSCDDAGNEDAASHARACFDGGVAPPLVTAAMGSPGVEVAGSAAKCLAHLLRHGNDVAFARELGRTFLKIVDIIRLGEYFEKEYAADLLDEILRLAPECSAAAEEAGALSAVAALRASY